MHTRLAQGIPSKVTNDGISTIDRNYESFRRTTAFGSLDGLRCICILAVVWHHAGTSGHGWRILDLGFLGVDLFFVISGFLIVTLLLRERSATGGISLRKFYIRRTLRIFPLYYGVILALAAFYGTLNVHSSYGKRFLSDLPYYLTYTADFAPVAFAIVWSLAAEEQFYLVWPSVERYIPKLVAPVLIALIAINQFVNFSAGKHLVSSMLGSTDWTQLSIFQTTFTPILLGVGAAHLLHSARGYRLLRFLVWTRWASAIYLIALIALVSMMPGDISGLSRLSIQIGMVALLISCVYREDHVLRPIFRLFPVRRIGQISYGIYLLHLQMIVLAAFLLHSSPQTGSVRLYAVGLLFTIIAAEVSFRCFENPILRFKEKFSVVHQAHT